MHRIFHYTGYHSGERASCGRNGFTYLGCRHTSGTAATADDFGERFGNAGEYNAHADRHLKHDDCQRQLALLHHAS
jgi:hypothetical protein